jgi:hypothetical protein
MGLLRAPIVLARLIVVAVAVLVWVVVVPIVDLLASLGARLRRLVAR